MSEATNLTAFISTTPKIADLAADIYDCLPNGQPIISIRFQTPNRPRMHTEPNRIRAINPIREFEEETIVDWSRLLEVFPEICFLTYIRQQAQLTEILLLPWNQKT
jgi:hypothetical protein